MKIEENHEKKIVSEECEAATPEKLSRAPVVEEEDEFVATNSRPESLVDESELCIKLDCESDFGDGPIASLKSANRKKTGDVLGRRSS